MNLFINDFLEYLHFIEVICFFVSYKQRGLFFYFYNN